MVTTATLESPYLTADEAAKYLRFPSSHAFRQATKKFGIPHVRRGRRLFFTKAKLDEFMSVATEATGQGSRQRRRRR